MPPSPTQIRRLKIARGERPRSRSRSRSRSRTRTCNNEETISGTSTLGNQQNIFMVKDRNRYYCFEYDDVSTVARREVILRVNPWTGLPWEDIQSVENAIREILVRRV